MLDHRRGGREIQRTRTPHEKHLFNPDGGAEIEPTLFTIRQMVMRKSTATLLTGLVLFSAGCGSQVTTADPGPEAPASSAPRQPVVTSPGVSTAKPEPSPVRPKGNVADPRKVRFESATAEDGGDRLRIVWWSGVEPCHTLDRVDVRESAGSVEVTLYEGTPEDAQNIACIEIAVQKTTTVDLKAPLDGREVVDGAK
jgi:hypothetical protein